MSDIQIESGIPIPPRAGGTGRPSKYPFDQLKPGDSFLVPHHDGNPVVTVRRMAAAVKGAAKRTGWKFTTRRLSEGLRVWRVA